MIAHVVDVECIERTVAFICPILNAQCGLEVTYAFRRFGPQGATWAVYVSDGSCSASQLAFLRILAEAVSRISINWATLGELRRSYRSNRETCDELDAACKLYPLSR